MDDAQRIVDRVQLVRMRFVKRDKDHRNIAAIRRGDYESVAPGLFNTAEFDKPLVANLIDTTARDIAEVMAPLPSVTCPAQALTSDADKRRQDLRGAIANGYIQNSRLQDQMFGGADRYGSFGFLSYIVEPDFEDQMPVIRVEDTRTSYYTRDYRGRVCEFFSVKWVTCDALNQQFPGANIPNFCKNKWNEYDANRQVEVARFYDDNSTRLVVLDPQIELVNVPNLTKRCPVRVVERPALEDDAVRGQFDDVIWVQIARALVQVYTLNALEQSVNAPLVVPDDVQEMQIGPLTTITTNQPNAVGRVNLSLSPGLFPEFATLAQEQRMGSRYPEGRSGSIDASIITGQGVQALMGTFDTQVQTFQRLNASALEDVIAMCFEMDERAWGSVKKTRRIKDNGAPRKYDYVPTKDISGDHIVDVSYGAIAGLDPNRGLVFVLQALAGGLLSKQTAMSSLPVDMNPMAEARQIQMEQLEGSIAASIAMLPQAIPQMAMGGGDPRELVLQIGQFYDLVAKGKSPAEAIQAVFAPKETEPPPEATPLEQAQGAGAGPAALPGAGQGGAADLLMSLAGTTPSGKPNLQSNVSRMRPAQG